MDFHKSASLFFFKTVLFYILISLLISFLLVLFLPALLTSPNSTSYQSLLSFFIFIPIIFYYKKLNKLKFNEMLYLKPISFKNIVFIIIFGFLMQPILQLVSSLTTFIFKESTSQFVIFDENASVIFLFFSMVILPAFFEEIIFRGMFLREYKDANFWYFIIFPALFFGLLHLNIAQFFYAFIAGMFFTFIVKVTKSIFSSFICHIIFNGTQFILLYNSINYDDISAILNLGFLILFLMSLLFFILFIYLFIKANKENIIELKAHFEKNKENKAKVFNSYFIWSLIIFFVFLLLNYISLDL